MIVEKSVDEIPKEWNRSFLLYTSPDIIEENRQALERLDDCVIFKHIPGEQSLDWENSASELADNLIFWFPHNTSDEELARWSLALSAHISSGKVIYGREILSEELTKKFETLDALAKGEQVPILSSFEDCIKAFEGKTKGAEIRKDGERYVPYHIWKHAAFQNWYANLKEGGNRLEKAKYAYDFRVGPGKAYLLYWTIYADIFITAENRSIERQVVLGRTDIKCVFPYYMPPGDNVSLLDCEVVLIKEFRSPATTDDCFIYELPGGSAFKPIEPLIQAANELKEEAGIDVENDLDRIQMHHPLQLASKITVHQAYMFSILLTEQEIKDCRKRAEEKLVLGNEEETERTYLKVMKFGDILNHGEQHNLIDWCMLGIMYSVLVDTLDSRSSARKSYALKRQSCNIDSPGRRSLPAPSAPVQGSIIVTLEKDEAYIPGESITVTWTNPEPKSRVGIHLIQEFVWVQTLNPQPAVTGKSYTATLSNNLETGTNYRLLIFDMDNFATSGFSKCFEIVGAS